LNLTPGRTIHSRVPGLFLFVPLLARLGFDRLIAEAAYPGSEMVPALSAMLSLLALKLLDKERRSHIDDFNCDEAVGLFAGLNILPKKSFATSYSYRTQRIQQLGLLQGWVKSLAPLMFPAADGFSLDFHPIPYRGDPKWLYFDSKVVDYPELSRLNQRKIHFVTIRRRGAAILRLLEGQPASAWKRAVIDIPKRCHTHIHYIEEAVRLRGYEGLIRQIAVTGLGRDRPTLFLSNDFEATPRELIIRYAGRNRIEDGLGISVNFFHLDCLASEVRLNVDLDAALTVIANGCYRWLASRLNGFAKADPKQLYRRFVETAGTATIQNDRLTVTFDRRSHNPILCEAELDRESLPIPWLGQRRLVFGYR
jgi:hypothetical protein